MSSKEIEESASRLKTAFCEFIDQLVKPETEEVKPKVSKKKKTKTKPVKEPEENKEEPVIGYLDDDVQEDEFFSYEDFMNAVKELTRNSSMSENAAVVQAKKHLSSYYKVSKFKELPESKYNECYKDLVSLLK